MRQRFLTAGSVLLLAAATAACSEGRAETGGPAISRTYQVGAFTGIEVMGPFEVKVATGKPISVAAQGPQKLLDSMEVTVEDGKLVIRPIQKKGWFGGMSWSSSESGTFTISVPQLASAEIAGSGEMDVDKVSGDRFDGGVAGSGHLRLPQVAVKQLALSIAGSGEINAAGQAQQASYEIAGSGDLDASRVTAVSTEADIAGSGNIRARATGTASADIAGSGNIEISGGAQCKTSKAGSGNIRCS